MAGHGPNGGAPAADGRTPRERFHDHQVHVADDALTARQRYTAHVPAPLRRKSAGPAHIRHGHPVPAGASDAAPPMLRKKELDSLVLRTAIASPVWRGETVVLTCDSVLEAVRGLPPSSTRSSKRTLARLP
jgi:hypothetical protein